MYESNSTLHAGKLILIGNLCETYSVVSKTVFISSTVISTLNLERNVLSVFSSGA